MQLSGYLVKIFLFAYQSITILLRSNVSMNYCGIKKKKKKRERELSRTAFDFLGVVFFLLEPSLQVSLNN